VLLKVTARHLRILLWLALILLVGVVIWVSRTVLLPFFLGLVLAYLLLPLVNWLDRRMPARLHDWHAARLLAGLIAFFVPLLVDQIEILIDRWPELAGRVGDWGTRGWDWYLENIPGDWREAIETGLRGLADEVVTTLRNAVVAASRTVFGTISFTLGLIVIPFWLFYILLDESQVKAGVIRALPVQLRDDVLCMARLVDDVLSAYIRGQLLLVLFVGGMATISLLIIGVPFALVLGVIAGIFEVLPYVGPILGAIPAVLVALLWDPASALWVALAFFAIQQVENLFLVPRIAGRSVKLHPALVMVVLVIATYSSTSTYGCWMSPSPPKRPWPASARARKSS
jgi:predicted PurR-regulated permease PerM